MIAWIIFALICLFFLLVAIAPCFLRKNGKTIYDQDFPEKPEEKIKEQNPFGNPKKKQ